jgi:glycosyltransferase involved in cell wall biosynthesis
MRIAIYENLPLGGARRASYELGRRLCLTHDVDLYRLSAYASGELDLAPNARRVRTVPYRPLWGLLGRRVDAGHLAPRSYTMFGPLKRLHRRLAAEIDGGGYDVVLAHTDAMTQSPYLLRWIGRTPTVYYCQEALRTYERSTLDQHRQKLMSSGGLVGRARVVEDRLVLPRWQREDYVSARAAGTIVVNSRYSRERVWAAYARNATVCHLGTDPDLFRPDPAVRREAEFLSIGLPVEAKGHALAVDALASLASGPDTAGRPRLRVLLPRRDGTERLERQAAHLGVDLVVEVGVTERTLVDRYRSAIATICAARLEPFGLTAIESMSCGTPVIAVREGGYVDSVVHGRTGLLVEPEAGDLAAAMGTMWRDRRRAGEMGRAGREHVLAEWTWDASACRLESILRAAAQPLRADAG